MLDLRNICVPELVNHKIVEYLQIHPDVLDQWRQDHKAKFEKNLGVTIPQFSGIIKCLCTHHNSIRWFFTCFVPQKELLMINIRSVMRKPVGKYLIPNHGIPLMSPLRQILR